MGEKIDKDGVIHEKGWDGQYRPKQGLWGPEKDTNLFGQPNIERDILGNPKGEKNWLGDPIQSKDGETLYRQRGGGGGGAVSGSGEGDEIIFGIILAVIGFVFLVAFKILKLVVNCTINGFQAIAQKDFPKALLNFIVPVVFLLLVFAGYYFLREASVATTLGEQIPRGNNVAQGNTTLSTQNSENKDNILKTTPTQSNPSLTQPSAGIVVVAVNNVNLRAGPGADYKIVGYAHLGDRIQSYGKSKDGKWIQVDPSGNTWIAASLVDIDQGASTMQPTQTSIQNGVVTVVFSSVNLRSGPGTDFGVVGYAYQGEKLPVYGRSSDGGWLQIDIDGQTWIAASVVEYVTEIAELQNSSSATNDIPMGFLIVVGAFGHHDKAINWETRFNDAGYRTLILYRQSNYRVVIPGYELEKDALLDLDKVQRELNEKAYIVGMSLWCPNPFPNKDWIECR